MEITRDLVFGVMALQKSLLAPDQLARAMAEQLTRGDSLSDLVVRRTWMSSAQCVALNAELDAALLRHGDSLQRVMDEIGGEPVSAQAGPASPAAPASGELYEHTLESANLPAEPALGTDAVPFEQTMDSAINPAAADQPAPFEQTMESKNVPMGPAPGTGDSVNNGTAIGDHTLTIPPTDGGVDLQAGSGGMDPVQINTVDFTPEQCSRYTLTRVYGEGGLGQVWLAIDPSLKREVALKNIRPGKDDPLARQRLIREAQITGQLEHPNIIPIYELDQSNPETTPYYTMRFLRGKTLHEKIAAYHKHRKAGELDPLELPELLNAFIDICHAIAYAGSRGVMHRDLKPQNIMLGDFGEVLVLDWGLAKQIDDKEIVSSEQRAPIQLTPASEASQTVIGQVMGSPAYMAPEQANGRIDLMDPRTDIYGLGAILFAILTGKGPHRGERTGNTAKDTMALLKRISNGETPSVLKFDSTIPKPLNAICLHAMARERDDRYQTGTELARDVQRYLADEPVSVYVEPWQQRAWRWVRRNRAWTQSAAAALVLTMVVSVVAFVIVNQARKREVEAHAITAEARAEEEKAKLAAQSAQQEATLRFRQARRAVDDSYTGISQTLLNYPGVQQLRTHLLEKAAEDYERFAEDRSDNPELRLEFALALVRLGDVRRLLGNFAESEQAYQRALVAFQKFLEEAPENADVYQALAQCYNALGMLHVTVGSLPEAGDTSASFAAAGDAYEHALDALAKLAGQDETLEVRRSRAKTLANQGVLLSRTADFDAAIDKLRAAATTFEQLAGATQLPADRSELAKTRISSADLLVQTGDNLTAESEIKLAIKCYEELVRTEDGEPEYLQGLADARITLANALLALGRTADRIPLYESSIADYHALIKTRPDVPLYRDRLVAAEINLAQVLNRLGRNADDESRLHAEVAFTYAVDLVNENQSLAENHAKEAYSLVTLGQVLRDRQELIDAETAFGKAEEKCSMLIEALPGDPRYLQLRGEVRNNLGTVQLLNEDYASARSTFANARNDLDEALKLAPENAFARDGQAWSLTYLGDTLRALDRENEARSFYQQALKILEQNGEDPDRQYQLGQFLVLCQDEEFRDPAEAAVIADRISRQHETNADYLVLAAAARYRQGQWQACCSKLDEATLVQLRGKSSIDFWRAMALARLQPDDLAEAKLAFERACAQMDKRAPGDLKLVRLRQEAAMVLGLNSAGGSAPSE